MSFLFASPSSLLQSVLLHLPLANMRILSIIRFLVEKPTFLFFIIFQTRSVQSTSQGRSSKGDLESISVSLSLSPRMSFSSTYRSSSAVSSSIPTSMLLSAARGLPDDSLKTSISSCSSFVSNAFGTNVERGVIASIKLAIVSLISFRCSCL